MKILVVTGSSGGHIFPALGFLDTLRDRRKNIDLLLVLPKKNISKQIENIDYRVNYISISSVKLKLDFKNFIAILRYFKGSVESMAILLAFRPDSVIGFGSLASVPMVLFAWFFRMKTLIHEQNVIPGRANRFLARFADKIAVSFTETRDYFKAYQRKIILTGNPIRKELNRIDRIKALEFFGFDKDKFTLLIMGGSQGSHRVNLVSLEAISRISDKFKLQVIHLSGPLDYDLLKHRYKDLNISLRLFSFLESMQYAYSACDLVVSRAGASTIAEIIFFALPAIIIPYPFAYRHQIANARVLGKAGSAFIIEDRDLDSNALSRGIESLLSNPDRIKSMRSCYAGLFAPDANKIFTENVLALNLKDEGLF